MPRLRVSVEGEAIRATRVLVAAQRVAYVFVASRPIQYRLGRSRVVYVGSSNYGLGRVTASVSDRAPAILGRHGVATFHAYVLTSAPRQRVKTWHKLERALLIRFRERFGEPPLCNAQGTAMRVAGEFDLFSQARIDSIIDDLS